MGVAFHFCVDMRQIQFLRFWQELFINATAANHHDFWYVTTRRDGFIHRLHPRYAIVRTRLTAEDNIFASRNGRPIDSRVWRPIITGLFKVLRLNRGEIGRQVPRHGVFHADNAIYR